MISLVKLVVMRISKRWLMYMYGREIGQLFILPVIEKGQVEEVLVEGESDRGGGDPVEVEVMKEDAIQLK